MECKPALLVNPYDTEAVAAAIYRALTMPVEERRARHSALYDIIAKNDINDWPGRFLSTLTGAPTIDAKPAANPALHEPNPAVLPVRRAGYRAN